MDLPTFSNGGGLVLALLIIGLLGVAALISASRAPWTVEDLFDSSTDGLDSYEAGGRPVGGIGG